MLVNDPISEIVLSGLQIIHWATCYQNDISVAVLFAEI